MLKTALLCFAVLLSVSITAQSIVLDSTDPLPSCMPVSVNETLNFVRGINCMADVVLLDVDDNEVFRTSDASFSYTFDTPGQFTFYCGAEPSSIAMAAVCVQIGSVPTLSEWGLICLGLILVIFSTSAIKTKNLLYT